MATTTQNQSVWEVIPKWLPILVVIAGGISSFGYAMAQQAHVKDRVESLEHRTETTDAKISVLEGDVRVILTNTEWIKEELKKRK